MLNSLTAVKDFIFQIFMKAEICNLMTLNAKDRRVWNLLVFTAMNHNHLFDMTSCLRRYNV